MRIPFTVAALALLPLAGNAQLTYALDSTTLLIDVVVDSDRVDAPWEILWGPDDRLWMTDGPRITRWDPLTDAIDTVYDRGRGNGLGMALHPDFPGTPVVMAVFDTGAYYASNTWCDVVRLDYDAVNDTIASETVLFGYYHAGEHAGGRVLFDTSGHVLVTTADYWLNGPDTLFSPVGKTLRFAIDGSVPADNPRADRTWTWGHRNPQGLAMLPNGAVVNTEHGQMYQSNEINLIQRNEDHGYPSYDGTSCFLFPDTCASGTYTFVPPLRTFNHPPSGAEFYGHTAIPEFTGRLICTILWHRGLMTFGFNADLDSITSETYLEGGAFDDMVRNRDIAIRPDGSFYLITNDRQDARIRWVHPDLSTSVGTPLASSSTLLAWPVPARDHLIVAGAGQDPLALFDALGRPCPVSVQRMGERCLLDVQVLPPGTYSVRAGTRSTRFIKP